MRVLLIDDNEELRGFLQCTLEESEIDCVATDAQSAPQHLDNERFDALIVDSVLMNTDGIALLQKLRATRNGRNLPALLMSPIDTGLARRMAKNAGYNHFLTKPFGPMQFLEQIRNLKI